ncbi:MAG: aminodeoxychorismate/anthranilate synthase component II [Deltaproteobacteria bacterium]|nr:aminodeoxychorismate/anthranilate synthase component II [Deltaproteobacteria bacterium]
MILVIDNYDSFTYNLVQYLGELGAVVEVYRNDAISVEEIESLSPEAILVSPGPGTPDDAGISLEVIRKFSGRYPLLGVCLGHQSIGQVFGAKVVRAERLMHGRTSSIIHDKRSLFRGLPPTFTATRYHSLILKPESIGEDLEVTAWTDRGEIMGVRHRKLDVVEGVQFHPESFLTEHGHAMLRNFLDQTKAGGTIPRNNR